MTRLTSGITALSVPGVALGPHLFAVTPGMWEAWPSAGSIPEFHLPPSTSFITPGIFETRPRSSPGFDFLIMWRMVLGSCSFQKPKCLLTCPTSAFVDDSFCSWLCSSSCALKVIPARRGKSLGDPITRN